MKNYKQFLIYVIIGIYVVSLLYFAFELTLESRASWYMFNGNTSLSNTKLPILENALNNIFWIKLLKLNFFAGWITASVILLVFNHLKKQTILVISSWALLIILFHVSTSKLLSQQYLIVFENQEVPESEIEKPLMKAGYGVCELLNEKIVNWDYQYRRYAISVIGKYKYEPAIDNLKKILYSDTEKYYIKCDCIQALKEINNEESRSIDSIYMNNLNPKEDSLIIDYLKNSKQ